MKTIFLKWYFYCIIKLNKFRNIKTMANRIHYDGYPCNIENDIKELGIDCYTTAATNLDKVNCPKCLKIISENVK